MLKSFQVLCWYVTCSNRIYIKQLSSTLRPSALATCKPCRLIPWPILPVYTPLSLCCRPYVLAEALDLSGIMAILFAGITHAHYTHYNLSPTTQGEQTCIDRV